MRPGRTDEALFKSSTDLKHEIYQFNYCVRRLALDFLQSKDGWLFSSLLTAFTISTRNLYQFFYVNSTNNNDMMATDFFDDSSFWENSKPTATLLLKEANKAASKLSAHLTYDREDKYRDYYWKWISIHRDMREPLRVFAANVPHQRVHPEILDFERYWSWTDKLPPQPTP